MFEYLIGGTLRGRVKLALNIGAFRSVVPKIGEDKRASRGTWMRTNQQNGLHTYLQCGAGRECLLQGFRNSWDTNVSFILMAQDVCVHMNACSVRKYMKVSII